MQGYRNIFHMIFFRLSLCPWVVQAQRLFNAAIRKMDRWRQGRDACKKELEEAKDTLSAHDKRTLERVRFWKYSILSYPFDFLLGIRVKKQNGSTGRFMINWRSTSRSDDGWEGLFTFRLNKT